MKALLQRGPESTRSPLVHYGPLVIIMFTSVFAAGLLFLPGPGGNTPAPSGYGTPAETTNASANTNPAGSGSDGGAPSPAGAEQAVIEITGFTFSESPVLVPGATVTVINNDSVGHTLTANDGSFDTQFLGPGESIEITVPDVPGPYSYFCGVHPTMTGQLVVG